MGLLSLVSRCLDMNPANLKDEAHRLVDRLPEQATWDDLMYEIYVRQSVEAGLRDSEANRVTDTDRYAKFLDSGRESRVDGYREGSLAEHPRLHCSGLATICPGDDRPNHSPDTSVRGISARGWSGSGYDVDDIREVLEYPYRIIYRVLPDRVDVLAVVHGARRLPASLPNTHSSASVRPAAS